MWLHRHAGVVRPVFFLIPRLLGCTDSATAGSARGTAPGGPPASHVAPANAAAAGGSRAGGAGRSDPRRRRRCSLSLRRTRGLQEGTDRPGTRSRRRRRCIREKGRSG